MARSTGTTKGRGVAGAAPEGRSEAARGDSHGRRVRRALLRRFRRPGALLGVVLLLVLLAAAVLAPSIQRHDPTAIHYRALQVGPDAEFWFGTDDLGRSVFARVLHGLRTSLLIGAASVGLALVIGVPLGLVAGYAGGRLDALIVRLLEIDLAFPSILLAIAIVAVLGPGTMNTVYAIAASTVPIYALTVRSTTRALAQRDYVQAARALGAGDWRILLRHLLPGVVPPLLVITTVNVGSAVLAAAGLGYLGLGAQPPTPELGTMLSEARAYLRQAWWMSVFPGLTITCLVLAMNLVGDALGDVYDVRSAGKRG
ncbi:MAG: ABC transporter permease [Trueperaceae bacterium]|nr:ABC transporter permease [Trueperaceae bacterium]